MARKPVVNQNLCIGCSACEGVCPEVFEMKENANNERKSFVKKLDDYEKHSENIEQAIMVCPVTVISWK